MSTFYIMQQGAVIGKVSERLKITLDKKVIAEIPLIKISQLVVYGAVMLTPPARRELLTRQIDVCFLSQHGRYYGRLQSEESQSAPLRIAQYKAALDSDQCLSLARGFVRGKLRNFRVTLIQKLGKQSHPKVTQAVKRIKTAERSAKSVKTLETLRAQEGEGSAAYFSVFDRRLTAEGVTFQTRVRRPPTDPVNALLSFGYTLLSNELLTAVKIVGFDPYIGYLHGMQYGRPGLALDLMEEFRPLIVDAMVVACINKKILTPDDFQETEDGARRLTDEGRRTFLTQYEQRLQTELTHPVLNRKLTYQQCVEQQVRLLAKTLRGQRDEYPPFCLT